MGVVEVPLDVLWGAQTQRALQHFRFDGAGEAMPLEIVHALAVIKQAAARVNGRSGRLAPRQSEAIALAAGEVADGLWDSQFPLPLWQSGSGTQSNMNVNEVVANRALVLMGERVGRREIVHPNDHVNLGQSSNDVVPAALHLATLTTLNTELDPEVDRLLAALDDRSGRWADVVKVAGPIFKTPPC